MLLKAGDLWRISQNAYDQRESREITRFDGTKYIVEFAKVLHGEIVEIPEDQEVSETDQFDMIKKAHLPAYEGTLDIYFWRLEPL